MFILLIIKFSYAHLQTTSQVHMYSYVMGNPMKYGRNYNFYISLWFSNGPWKYGLIFIKIKD